LLTRYGRIDEVWFDGANGEGPNGKKQTYDWPRFWGLVRRLQPQAVMFSDAGPDIRWIGNERGVAGDTNWSTMKSDAVPYPGADGPGIIAALQNGDPDGTVWRPGETDVSIRPGWFYHAAEDERVKTVDQLVDLYFTSVGRNSKLLLNVPPARAGLLHETDVARLTGMRRSLVSLLQNDSAKDAERRCPPAGGQTSVCEIDLRRTTPISIIELSEDIASGQSVSSYRLEDASSTAQGQPHVIATGTTIGYKRLVRIPTTSVRVLKLSVQAGEATAPRVRVRVY
jgi:alpha-L-fucosidase